MAEPRTVYGYTLKDRPPSEKEAFVWSAMPFARAVSVEIPPALSGPLVTVGKLYGCTIKVDSGLPDGVVELRSTETGRLLGRIVNVGIQINEMG